MKPGEDTGLEHFTLVKWLEQMIIIWTTNFIDNRSEHETTILCLVDVHINVHINLGCGTHLIQLNWL